MSDIRFGITFGAVKHIIESATDSETKTFEIMKIIKHFMDKADKCDKEDE